MLGAYQPAVTAAAHGSALAAVQQVMHRLQKLVLMLSRLIYFTLPLHEVIHQTKCSPAWSHAAAAFVAFSGSGDAGQIKRFYGSSVVLQKNS